MPSLPRRVPRIGPPPHFSQNWDAWRGVARSGGPTPPALLPSPGGRWTCAWPQFDLTSLLRAAVWPTSRAEAAAGVEPRVSPTAHGHVPSPARPCSRPGQLPERIGPGPQFAGPERGGPSVHPGRVPAVLGKPGDSSAHHTGRPCRASVALPRRQHNLQVELPLSITIRAWPNSRGRARLACCLAGGYRQWEHARPQLVCGEAWREAGGGQGGEASASSYCLCAPVPRRCRHRLALDVYIMRPAVAVVVLAGPSWPSLPFTPLARHLPRLVCPVPGPR